MTMKNDERRAWKKHPLPWKQISEGDIVDANGQFVDFNDLVNSQLARVVAAMNSIYDEDWIKKYDIGA